MLKANGGNDSWLETPTMAEWPDHDDPEENPFIKWRKMLNSWHRAKEAGWSDDDYKSLVTQINQAIYQTSGKMFRITPTGIWKEAAAVLPSSVLWKDETANVGGSHKARHLMGLLLHFAIDAGADDKRLAISSCGNAALGAATLARAVGRPIDVFIPTWANPAIVTELKKLEADIHVCERLKGEIGDPCMLRFQESLLDGSIAFGVQATENQLTLDGGRTIGWELATALQNDPVDDLVIQVGGGALLTSCAIGLMEAKEFNILEKVPRIWATQSEGCAPLNRAWESLPKERTFAEVMLYARENSADLMKPWDNPKSLASGILDDVTYDWLGVIRSLLLSDGGSIVSSEKNIISASQLVSSLGINAEPTGAASVAGVISLLEDKIIDQSQKVGVLITGVNR